MHASCHYPFHLAAYIGQDTALLPTSPTGKICMFFPDTKGSAFFLVASNFQMENFFNESCTVFIPYQFER